jgi:hypothetical protein
LNTGASLVFSNWNTRLEAADAVSIMSNGVVTLPAPFTETGISNRVWIVCRDFTLLAGGVINADERGYANDNGFGKGALGTAAAKNRLRFQVTGLRFQGLSLLLGIIRGLAFEARLF